MTYNLPPVDIDMFVPVRTAPRTTLFMTTIFMTIKMIVRKWVDTNLKEIPLSFVPGGGGDAAVQPRLVTAFCIAGEVPDRDRVLRMTFSN